ncbi:MAG TPA: type II toxin-antitoxin system RelE/ParE family toxin [Acidiferrobacterales bacterium]|jgi:toxin ParE1/3/4
MLYYDSLKNCLELLGENPGIGTNADDLRPGYRRFVHESHVIFYRETAHGVLIVRILHKRMDVDRHLECLTK